MINKDEFTKALTNPDYFNKGLVYTIINGKDTCVNESYKSWSDFITHLPNLVADKVTFKVQGFETFNKEIYNKCYELSLHWKSPVDCHAYWSYAGQNSFDMHKDPCEVAIFVCSGTKILTVDSQTFNLKENDHIFIKANTPHKASHDTDCLSLSFGTFDFDVDNLAETGIVL